MKKLGERVVVQYSKQVNVGLARVQWAVIYLTFFTSVSSWAMTEGDDNGSPVSRDALYSTSPFPLIVQPPCDDDAGSTDLRLTPSPALSPNCQHNQLAAPVASIEPTENRSRSQQGNRAEEGSLLPNFESFTSRAISMPAALQRMGTLVQRVFTPKHLKPGPVTFTDLQTQKDLSLIHI